MSKNVVICYDGTWNQPGNEEDDSDDEETNVRRLFEDMERGGAQSKWYDPGVGTHWYDGVRGGVFGWGLSRNVRQGYARLAKVYRPGDRIFLFGFSRGAFTARSLSGLIRKCGVIDLEKVPRNEKGKRKLKQTIKRAYALYKKRKVAPDDPPAREFRQTYGHRGFAAQSGDDTVPEIWFIGVWDTVEALGVPGKGFNWFNKNFKFHDAKLSRYVKHACHALAIDEHRRTFKPTLWKTKAVEGQVVEQKWFVGAHADVGGGYARHDLSDIAYTWMAGHAGDAGLKLIGDYEPKGADAYKGKLHDSYAKFMRGWYKRVFSRHYRALGDPVPEPGILHPTVNQRYESDVTPQYRPKNLRKYKEAGGH